MMKIDLHVHTSHGSGCAYMDPDQLVRKAKSVGLDGVCITEHDQIWSRDNIERLKKKHDFLVIGGVEVSTDFGHVLVFGLHNSVREVGTISELRKIVSKEGGVMALAHPFRYEPDIVGTHFLSTSNGSSSSKELEKVCNDPGFKLIDIMEVYNGHSGIKEINFTALVAKRLGLKAIGGSDAHATLELGTSYTVFEEEIKDEKGFITQLKNGRFFGVDTRWSEGLVNSRPGENHEAFG
jgi:predicted metal-dependent phosphoesterase TrpH